MTLFHKTIPETVLGARAPSFFWIRSRLYAFSRRRRPADEFRATMQAWLYDEPLR